MASGSIHVIGGASGIGYWFITSVFPPNLRIHCYDVNGTALNRLPDHVAKCHLRPRKMFREYRANFSEGDTILFSVPPHQLRHSLVALQKYVRSPSLLVSMNSVQEPAIRLLTKLCPAGSYFMGCHPLFGPTVASPDGYAVVLTKYDDGNSLMRSFANVLSRAGLINAHLSAEEHDLYMSIVQTLPHFCLLSFSKALTESGLEIAKLLNVRTPNFQFLYAFAARLLMLSPTTTGSIQKHQLANKIRSGYIKSCRDLDTEFRGAKGVVPAALIVEKIRQPFRGSEIEEGAKVAVVAVDALQRFEAVLQRYKRREEPFIFRHRVNRQLHIVRILDVLPDEIRVEDAALPHLIDERTLYAVRYDKIANENYKRIGINFPEHQRSYPVKKKFIELLTSEQVGEFHQKSIVPIATEYNFQNAYGRDEEFFEARIPQLVRGVLECKFLDAFQRKGSPPMVRVHLTFQPRFRRSDIIESINSILIR